MTYNVIAKKLDKFYKVTGLIGASFLVVILVLIVVQMISRWFSIVILRGSIEYIGYSMAASSILCLGYALERGHHIRVDLISSKIKGKTHLILCIWCFLISIIIAIYFLYYQTVNVWYSYEFNDVSQGEDATPLWIPQLVMPIGAFIFFITLVDHTIRTIISGRSVIFDK